MLSRVTEAILCGVAEAPMQKMPYNHVAIAPYRHFTCIVLKEVIG